MKRHILIAAFFAFQGLAHAVATGMDRPGRYEASGYFNYASYGRNVAMQTDIGLWGCA